MHPRFHPRLELALGHLRGLGYQVQEGACLRDERKHVRAPKHERAADFMRLWADEGVGLLFPPWGGSLGMEVLPLLDFEAIARHPKWIQGHSDISTLLLAITLRCDLATAHGPNLLDSIHRAAIAAGQGAGTCPSLRWLQAPSGSVGFEAPHHSMASMAGQSARPQAVSR